MPIAPVADAEEIATAVPGTVDEVTVTPAAAGSSAAEASTAPGATFRHRRDIDGLRAIAVLLVVAYHFHVPGTKGGFIGVDVFYVLSGFLITRLLLGELARRGTVDLREFYARRARRLLPAAAVVLLVTTALSAVLLPPLRAVDAAHDAVAASTYLSNWRFAAQATDYLSADSAPSPFLHFWSLGVEEQFYLLWPALILLVALLGPRTVAAVRRRVLALAAATFLISLIASILLTPTTGMWAFYGLHTRAWELAAGAVLAGVLVSLEARAARGDGGLESLSEPTRRTLALVTGFGGLAALAWSTAAYAGAATYPGSAALVPVLGAIAVLVSGSFGVQTVIQRALSVPLAGWIGKLSYSWYLWHWPVVVLGTAVLADPTTGQMAALFLLSLGLAWLSYTFVENPMRHATVLASWRRSLAFAAAVMVIGVTVPLGIVGAITSAQDSTAAANGITPAPAAAREDTSELYRNGCVVSIEGTTSPECRFGTPGGPVVALFGDSHAAQWYPALEEIADQRGWQVEVLVKSNCPAVEVTRERGGAEYAACTTWRADSMRRLAGEDDVVAVLTSSATDPELLGADGTPVRGDAAVATWREASERTYADLTAIAPIVVTLTDTPRPGFDVPECVSAHLDDPSACDFAPKAGTEAFMTAQQDAALAAGTTVVDTWAVTCPDDTTCHAVEDGMLTLFDHRHLTATYSRSLAPELGRALDRAWADVPAARELTR